MATSSIFASFDINDPATAERFVEALDTSASDSKPRANSSTQMLTGINAIKDLWRKRQRETA